MHYVKGICGTGDGINKVAVPSLASMICIVMLSIIGVGFGSAHQKVALKNPVWQRAIAGAAPYEAPVFATSSVLAIDLAASPATSAQLEKTGEIELLDAQSGATRTRLSWSAPANSSNFGTHAIIPLDAERFVVRNWNKLNIVSSTGEVLATRKLLLESSQADNNSNLTLWDHWQLASSRDGSTILATRRHGRATEMHWLSNDTLQDIQVESIDTSKCCSAVSDAYVVYADHPKSPTLIRDRRGQEYPLCDKCIGGDASFVDNKEVVLSIKPERRLLVVSASGEVSTDLKLPGSDDKIYQMSVARLSKQIALLVGPQHFGGTPKGFSAYIYDAAIKKITFELQILEQRNEQEIVKAGSSMHFESTVSPQIALSPDGKRLAILNQGTLYMYATSP